jgi:hypothetical protein
MHTNIKIALTCKHIANYQVNNSLVSSRIPSFGDVGIFRVLQPNGGYIVNPEGSNVYLFENDLVMLSFGSRYATNQYEGYVPYTPVKQCQLLGRGGVAGSLTSKNATFKVIPVQLELVAYATNHNGQVINTIRWEKMDSFNKFSIAPKVILSVGTSMDSGKTTSAAWLCGGLNAAGHRVAYVKLTGTAFPKDAALNRDRGAHITADFSDFGFPSTYLLDRNVLLDLYQSLINKVCAEHPVDFVVMEIADGLLQRETSMLLEDPNFRSTIYATLFCAGDSLGVLSGLQYLESCGLTPFAVSGLFTASDLLIREVKDRIDLPILTLTDLLKTESIRLLDQTGMKLDENSETLYSYANAA